MFTDYFNYENYGFSGRGRIERDTGTTHGDLSVPLHCENETETISIMTVRKKKKGLFILCRSPVDLLRVRLCDFPREVVHVQFTRIRVKARALKRGLESFEKTLDDQRRLSLVEPHLYQFRVQYRLVPEAIPLETFAKVASTAVIMVPF